MSVKVVAEDVKVLGVGAHIGVIKDVVRKEVQHKNETFVYADIVITIPNEGCDITAGYPLRVTEKTELGSLLSRFGVVVIVGQEYDLAEILKGRSVEFWVNKNDKGYSEVVKETLKPKNGNTPVQPGVKEEVVV